MSERKYYCYCDSNCKFETMTKEQILAAIAQAVETGSVGNVDTGFVTKVKDTNKGVAVTFWVGTQAQYNALAEIAENCMYIITDDTTTDDIKAAFAAAVASAESAAAAAAAMVAVDITDKITYTTTTKPSGVGAWQQGVRYSYDQAAGIVRFSGMVGFYGEFLAGESLVLAHDAYCADQLTTHVSCDSPKFKVEYKRDGLHITAREDVSSLSSTSSETLRFSGWYFCDGE